VVEGTDGTADILRQLSKAKDAPTFTIIEPAKRRGLSAAFKLGFAAALEGADQSKLYLVEALISACSRGISVDRTGDEAEHDSLARASSGRYGSRRGR
jgi:hypothetical protein